MSLAHLAQEGSLPGSLRFMSQAAVQPGSDNIMQCTPQSRDTRTMLVGLASSTNSSSSRSSPDSSSDKFGNNINRMQLTINYSYPSSGGSTTPVSTRSSYESNISSSSSSMSMQKQSVMKSSLKSSQSVGTNLNRRSSPPTVRFADPEPLPKAHTWPASRPKAIQQPRSRLNRIPNPMLHSRHHHTRSLSNLNTVGPYPYAVPHPPRVSRPSERASKISQNQISITVSPPAPHHTQGPGWSNSPVPSRPAITPASRVPSQQSTVSNVSTQSAPAVLLTPTPTITTPPGQYNPLQHYQPCLYSSCTAHYTPAHAGFTYYLPSSPYSLAKLHGYCPRHATRELREANATCKRQWESLRQHAGRKTLGSIATEFELFVVEFRQQRVLEDAKLVRELKKRIVGVEQVAGGIQRQNDGSDKEKAVSKQIADCDKSWDWRYTPRPCATSSCSSVPYSPYANHLYAFYHTRRPSRFLPLPTLCPSCSKAEVETFEKKVTEKQASRCGWNEAEWNEWFGNLVKDREMGVAFSVAIQEKAVKERGPARWAEREGEKKEVKDVVAGKKGKKSIFRRFFGGMSA